MKKILVPTDFSGNALKAAMYAAEIAKKNGASIYFLHAAQMGHDKFYQPVSYYEKYNNLVLDEDQERMEGLKKLMKKNYPGIYFETSIDASSPIPEAIRKFCRKYDIDIVIMGTQGATGIKSVLMGSVASAVIAKCPVPVLAIPADYEPQEPDGIVLATNQFEEDPSLLEELHSFLKIFQAKLHVVVFIDKFESDAADYVTNLTKLEHYTHFLKTHFQGIEIKTEVIEGDSTEDGIELYSLQHDIDMIAVISYPKTFLDKLFRKSFTRKMAFHSKIPVLAIPASSAVEQ